MEKLCGEQQNAPTTALSKDDEESMWYCCCPAPYIHCEESAMNPTCLAAMKTHVGEPMRKPLPTFKSVHAAQQVREDVWKSDPLCKLYFASPMPYQQCMKDPSGLMRAVERADLNCETLTWQYEVLSDGDLDEFEFNECPLPGKRALALDGEQRKAPFKFQDQENELNSYQAYKLSPLVDFLSRLLAFVLFLIAMNAVVDSVESRKKNAVKYNKETNRAGKWSMVRRV